MRPPPPMTGEAERGSEERGPEDHRMDLAGDVHSGAKPECLGLRPYIGHRGETARRWRERERGRECRTC